MLVAGTDNAAIFHCESIFQLSTVVRSLGIKALGIDCEIRSQYKHYNVVESVFSSSNVKGISRSVLPLFQSLEALLYNRYMGDIFITSAQLLRIRHVSPDSARNLHYRYSFACSNDIISCTLRRNRDNSSSIRT